MGSKQYSQLLTWSSSLTPAEFWATVVSLFLVRLLRGFHCLFFTPSHSLPPSLSLSLSLIFYLSSSHSFSLSLILSHVQATRSLARGATTTPSSLIATEDPLFAFVEKGKPRYSQISLSFITRIPFNSEIPFFFLLSL